MTWPAHVSSVRAVTKPASVIVRARNEAPTIERVLTSLHRQTVPPEVIVIDSGSTDGTAEIARHWCDRLIEIPPERFTYGYALNVGAMTAAAPFHFALSAHCVVDRADWIERSLAHYQRADVAATNGLQGPPGASAPFYQDAAHARDNPYFGFSNHASSWRAEVWQEFPFDEQLDYAEDKEWAMRVLQAGWVIVFDPHLDVDMSHVWRSGAVEYYRRQKRAVKALGTFASLPPYSLRHAVQEWWQEPGDRRPPWRRRLNPVRAAGLAGKYQGHRELRRRLTTPSAGP